MIAPPPSIPQAHATLAHYAPSIKVHTCRRGRRAVTCTGTQAMCVYHGARCVPASPVRYRFRLDWNRERTRVLITTHWETEA